MSQGFLKGVLIGAVVSVGAAAGLSLVSGGPVMKVRETAQKPPVETGALEEEGSPKQETTVETIPATPELPVMESDASSQLVESKPETPEMAVKEKPVEPAPQAPKISTRIEPPVAPGALQEGQGVQVEAKQDSAVEAMPKPAEVVGVAPEKAPGKVEDVPAKAPDVQSVAPALPATPVGSDAVTVESPVVAGSAAAITTVQPDRPMASVAKEGTPVVGETAIKAAPVLEEKTEPEQPVTEAAPEPETKSAEAEAEPAVKPDVVTLGQEEEVAGAIRVGRPASDFKSLGTGVQTGRLPRISVAGGGETEAAAESQVAPIERFAEPFQGDENKAKMAIVLMDVGDPDVGIEALSTFPYPLSIAVDTSRDDATEKMEKYRAAGLEVLAMVRLPDGATPADVEVALPVLMAKVPEAVAVMEAPEDGIQFDRKAADQVARILSATGHGLLLFPKGLNTAQKLAAKNGVPSATVFRDVDGKGQNAGAIRRFLNYGALNAANEGGVVEVARLHPDTVAALLVWALDDRAGQVALAPVSHLLKVQ